MSWQRRRHCYHWNPQNIPSNELLTSIPDSHFSTVQRIMFSLHQRSNRGDLTSNTTSIAFLLKAPSTVLGNSMCNGRRLFTGCWLQFNAIYHKERKFFNYLHKCDDDNWVRLCRVCMFKSRRVLHQHGLSSILLRRKWSDDNEKVCNTERKVNRVHIEWVSSNIDAWRWVLLQLTLATGDACLNVITICTVAKQSV